MIREPDAGKPHVRFDEREVETEHGRRILRHARGNPDTEVSRSLNHRATSRLYNLNTHNAQSLIEAFGEKEAKTLLKRIRWHYTPKHASWLNMAEIEISAIGRQCLDRRLPTFEDVVREAAACSRDRNRQKIMIEWTFQRADARRVFPELYRPRLAG